MGKNSKIEWLQGGSTASPWYGCTKISPGCVNCFAETWAKRAGKDCWGNGKPRIKSKSFERECKKLNALGKIITLTNTLRGDASGWHYLPAGEKNRKVFPSLCDWLDPEVPAEWLADMLRVIHQCPNLDFLLLTKRPELWVDRMQSASWSDKDGTGAAHFLLNGMPDNVWVGTSCENQEMADKRIPELLKIPAKVRFLSLEPLLGPIALSGTRPDRLGAPINFDWLSGIHWVIVGGESGHGARPCNVEWIRSIVRQCKQAGVPVFVKQDCGRIPGQQGRIPDDLWKIKEVPNA